MKDHWTSRAGFAKGLSYPQTGEGGMLCYNCALCVVKIVFVGTKSEILSPFQMESGVAILFGETILPFANS